MRLAPTIFQQRIAARHHLRATYVDGDIFTASLTTRQTFAQDDWRLDPSRDTVASNLDADTTLRVRELMRVLGLRYGAIDFVVDNEALPCFLEVNPSGQFLFCEIHAGLAISHAIASALTGPRTDSVMS
jgi:glutathione synthase/RimK-type ligase-like ATP-grasp enzyme